MQLDEEFYDRIVALTDQNAASEPPLELYLRSLLGILEGIVERINCDEGELFDMLAAAYKSPPQDFDQEWSKIEESDESPASYEAVAKTLKRQIAQLRSFRAEEVAKAQIYLDSGECWNNFSVEMYLECAAAGAAANSRIKNRSARSPTSDWDDIRLFFWMGAAYE